MSDDRPPPPKRVVVVRLTARQKSDAAAALVAIRDAVRTAGVTLRVCTTPDESIPSVEADWVKDEVLETKGREVLAAVLDQAAADHQEKAADAKRNANRKLAEIEAREAGLVAFLSFQMGRGIQITVDVYEKVAGLVGKGAERVAGLFGGKDEVG